jgi:hypothetical protein
MLDCAMAATFPQVMVSAETHMATTPQEAARSGKAATNTRSRAANPPALAPTDMKATTAEGAPW